MKSPPLRIGLYPGTFDPITLGHMEIIARAAKIVDRLVIGVAKNAGKGPLFDCKTRVKLVQQSVASLVKHGADIQVVPFENLLLHFARETGATLIIRGLRAVSDFEYEFQMAGMNHRVSSDIETVFLMASDRHQFIASRFVKEIARLGGEVDSFVAPHVVRALKQRFSTDTGRRKVVPEIRD